MDSEQDQDEELWSRENRECPTSICSAENANALRFEKPWGKKPTTAKKLIKDDKDTHKMAMKYEDEDEDDGDDEDDDDDDDDDEDDDDDYLSDGEQEAFMSRMTCLMRSLDTHTRAITRNLKILQTRLNKAQDRSNQGATCRKPDFNAHPKGKWFENPQQEQKDPEQCVPTSIKRMDNHQDNPYTPLSPSSNGDNQLMVSPLLKLINSPAALQSKQDSSGYWIPAPISTRSEAMDLDDMAASFNKRSKGNPRERYGEYESRLRRLMANRDAIEKNVMKVMTPPRRMPRG
ncbi:hypothetical protein KR067_007389 [Drosophila pandora]|nr:hypothetical protein KR067_007389 [Drosophila pandora]